MNRFFIMLCCLMALSTSAVQAQESSITLNQNEHSVFTGLFKSVWAKLKSFNPTKKQSANTNKVYTAGIRGAEATDTLLKPYWKNDLTQDQAFQKELEKFSLAQSKMDQGDLKSAIQSFDEFLDQYGKGSLRPNALFGLSISHAGTGDNQQSVATMQLFVSENPNHPLVADARQIISQLQ